MKNTKSIALVVLALLVLLTPAVTLASIQEEIERKIQEVFAKYQGDKAIVSGLNTLLTSKAYVNRPFKDHLQLLNTLINSKSAAWVMSTQDVVSLSRKELDAVIEIVLTKGFKDYKTLYSLVSHNTFKRLHWSVRQRVLQSLGRNPRNLATVPGSLDDLYKFIGNRKQLFKQHGKKAGVLILKIAADYPAAIDDICNFVGTTAFSTAYYKHHNTTGSVKQSKATVKAMLVRVIAATSAYWANSSGDAKKLLRNTLDALVKGTTPKVLLALRNYSHDGQAKGTVILLNISASRFSIDADRIFNDANMVDTVAHEVNHCTRKVNMNGSNYGNMMDEYIAWYVGTFARKGTEPTGDEMYKIYASDISGYPQVTGAKSPSSSNHSHYQKFHKEMLSLKGSNTKAPMDTNRYDKYNTFNVTYRPYGSYADASSTNGSTTVASASPVDTGMGLLGQTTGAVAGQPTNGQPAAKDEPSTNSGLGSGALASNEPYASNEPSKTSEPAATDEPVANVEPASANGTDGDIDTPAKEQKTEDGIAGLYGLGAQSVDKGSDDGNDDEFTTYEDNESMTECQG